MESNDGSMEIFSLSYSLWCRIEFCFISPVFLHLLKVYKDVLNHLKRSLSGDILREISCEGPLSTKAKECAKI